MRNACFRFRMNEVKKLLGSLFLMSNWSRSIDYLVFIRQSFMKFGSCFFYLFCVQTYVHFPSHAVEIWSFSKSVDFDLFFVLLTKSVCLNICVCVWHHYRMNHGWTTKNGLFFHRKSIFWEEEMVYQWVHSAGLRMDKYIGRSKRNTRSANFLCCKPFLRGSTSNHYTWNNVIHS